MEKSKDFESYFSDEALTSSQLERMQLTRQLAHDIYPEVQERVAYAMPGFYPQYAKKATQQLFLVRANKHWLGLYGVPGIETYNLKDFLDQGVEFGKGSLRVPYDLEYNSYERLIELIIHFNAKRHGLDLM